MNIPSRRRAVRAAAVALSPLVACGIASAQLSVDTFDHGSNPDGWVAWDLQYSSIAPSGGNPLEYLRLDNVGGQSTCQYVFIETRGVQPFAQTGDWRAAGVEQVTADIDIRQGRFGGIFCVFLASDPGTPANAADDCYLVLIHPTPAPAAPGWTRYEFPLPAADVVAPAGWFAANACSTAPIDQVWNAVVTDVDRIFFVLDANPGAPCTATNWDLGIDNIAVQSGTLGTVYCAALANSTGSPARIAGSGSRVVAQNDVDFEVDRLPPNGFGYFIMSRTAARTPVAAGELCLGGTITRYSLFVQHSGNAGRIQFSPNLPALPPASAILPGSTWRFQYWFRDAGPTSSFSPGMEVRFE